MTIYERIRQLRIANNLSQEDLARAMGYRDRSMITKIESGKVDISQKKIVAFANALNTTPAYLMGWTEKPDSPYIGRPKTEEARIISGAVDKMPPADRERALKLLEAVYADYFEKEEDKIS